MSTPLWMLPLSSRVNLQSWSLPVPYRRTRLPAMASITRRRRQRSRKQRRKEKIILGSEKTLARPDDALNASDARSTHRVFVSQAVVRRTKICSKCHMEKPYAAFHINRSYFDGLQSWCKECVKKYDKLNKSHRREQRRDRLRQRKVAALEAYGSSRCIRCGFDHLAALEFHHRDSSTKLFEISIAVMCLEKYSWDEILKEIAKCDLLCANCHRIEHFERELENE